jgi:type II secretion system protein H
VNLAAPVKFGARYVDRKYMPAAASDSRQQGFTLIELLVVIVLMGVTFTLAVGPYVHYRTSQQHMNSAREIVSVLRNAQTRSVAEERVYRVVFSPSSTNSAPARSYTVSYRETGGASYTTLSTSTTLDKNLWVASATFDNLAADPDAVPGSVYFYPRGTATQGTLVVGRTGSAKTYTVTVEGLTGRVSSNAD